MLFEENLERYECALSNDKHFVVQPVLSSCGHYICKDCATITIDHKIKCKICGRKCEVNSHNGKELTGFLREFQVNIDKIILFFEHEFDRSIKLFKENLKKINECVENRIEYIKNEIEIRIDSIKFELDRLNNNLRNELDESKKNFISEIQKFDVEPYETLLDQLKNDNHAKQYQQVSALNDFKKKLQNLHRMNDEIKQVDYHVTFEPNTNEIDSSIIGSLAYSYNDSFDISTRLKTPSYEIIDTKFRIYDLCSLPCGSLLAAIFDQSNLVVYDRNFKIIKIIDRINHQTFKPISIDRNPVTNSIYICDYSNHRIIMLDAEFNFIKSVGIQGSELYQFNSPNSVCYSKHFLYVCDASNKRLHKLSQNLDSDHIIHLDFIPSRIKIINDVACIRASNICSIVFYDLINCKIKWKYDGHNGSINLIKSNFCEYYHLHKVFYCYDDNGMLNEELKIDLVELIRDKEIHDTINHVRLIEFHNRLVLTCHESKQLILL